MFKQRIITVIIGLPVLILIAYKGTWVLLLGLLALLILGMSEYIEIVKKAGYGALEKAMYICGTLLLLEAYFWQGQQTALFSFIIFLVLTYQWLLQKQVSSVSALSVSFLGIIYLSLFKYVLLLRALPEGFLLVIIIFLLTWMVDTGAYFFGSLFGKNKLAPNISPNKTKEGAVGGFFSTILVALVIHFTIFPMGIINAVLLGSLIACIGQTGDMFESLLKRKAHIKDSGKIFPGHGGILDRFDSILFTVPAAYYFLTLVLLT